MNLTLPLVRDTFRACYDHTRLALLYDREMTPVEVATRNDGEWATVPPQDRIWTLTQPGVLSERTLRLFACWCATQALDNEEACGRTVDPRSREAVRVSALFAEGLADEAARSAAWSAAGSAAGSAAWSAAGSAAWSAAGSAAWSAAGSADEAARSAAWSAAEAEFRARSLAHLVTMIEAEMAVAK